MRLQLETRQAQLLEVLEQVDAILASPVPPDVALSGALRVGVRELLAEEFRFKEDVLLRLRRFGIPHVDRQVARCRSAMLALQVAYRFHCVDWDEEALARDWSGFVPHARKLIARVRVLAAYDRAQLFPLLDQLLGGEGRADFVRSTAAHTYLMSITAPPHAI